MALDFPNPPLTVGATYSSAGVTWVWDGTKWESATASGTGTVTSVTAGNGLTGGTITTTGTIALSAPVSIANGGTNATTAATACTNLGALPLTGGTLTGALNGTSIVATSGSFGGVAINSNNIAASGSGSAIGGVNFNGGGNFSTSGLATINNVNASLATIGAVVFPGGGSGTLHPTADNASWCGLAPTSWYGVSSYNFVNASDPRGKENMQPAPAGGLDKIKAIQVYEFIYASDPMRKLVTGFDATEVRKYHHHAVIEGEDEAKTLAINLPDMIALLWQAVQELSAEVASLRGG